MRYTKREILVNHLDDVRSIRTEIEDARKYRDELYKTNKYSHELQQKILEDLSTLTEETAKDYQDEVDGLAVEAKELWRDIEMTVETANTMLGDLLEDDEHFIVKEELYTEEESVARKHEQGLQKQIDSICCEAEDYRCEAFIEELQGFFNELVFFYRRDKDGVDYCDVIYKGETYSHPLDTHRNRMIQEKKAMNETKKNSIPENAIPILSLIGKPADNKVETPPETIAAVPENHETDEHKTLRELKYKIEDAVLNSRRATAIRDALYKASRARKDLNSKVVDVYKDCVSFMYALPPEIFEKFKKHLPRDYELSINRLSKSADDKLVRAFAKRAGDMMNDVIEQLNAKSDELINHCKDVIEEVKVTLPITGERITITPEPEPTPTPVIDTEPDPESLRGKTIEAIEAAVEACVNDFEAKCTAYIHNSELDKDEGLTLYDVMETKQKWIKELESKNIINASGYRYYVNKLEEAMDDVNEAFKQKRIQQRESASTPAPTPTPDCLTITHESPWYVIVTPKKPDAKTLAAIKGAGFRWYSAGKRWSLNEKYANPDKLETLKQLKAFGGDKDSVTFNTSAPDVHAVTIKEIQEKAFDDLVKSLNDGHPLWLKSWFSVAPSGYSYASGKSYSLRNNILLAGHSDFYLTEEGAEKVALEHGHTDPGLIAGAPHYYILAPNIRKIRPDENGKYDELTEELIEQVGKERATSEVYGYRLQRVYPQHFFNPDAVPPKQLQKLKLFDNDRDTEAEKIVSQFITKHNIVLNEIEGSANPTRTRTPDGRIAVNMPSIRQFQMSIAYYSVLFHELTHAANRIRNCQLTKDREELSAEIGSWIILNTLGFDASELIGDMASYCKSYINVANEKNAMRKAYTHALASANLVLEPIVQRIKQEEARLASNN